MAAPAANLKDDELEELIFKPVRAQLRQPGSSVMDFPKSCCLFYLPFVSMCRSFFQGCPHGFSKSVC